MKDAKGHGSAARGGSGQMVKDMRAHLVATHQSGIQKLARNMGRFVVNESGAGRAPFKSPEEVQQDPDAHAGMLETVATGLHEGHVSPHEFVAGIYHYLHFLAALAVADGTVHLFAHFMGWPLS